MVSGSGSGLGPRVKGQTSVGVRLGIDIRLGSRADVKSGSDPTLGQDMGFGLYYFPRLYRNILETIFFPYTLNILK